MVRKTRLVSTWPFSVELLALADLTVDLRYQRPPQPIFVERLISQFDERLVGVLDVSQREDGTHAILDGAQRFQALLKHKKDVWCAVYTGMSLADEAKHFYEINKNRRTVHPYYQIRALIVTGDKRAQNIDRIVNAEGYKLGIGTSGDHILSAVRALEEAYDNSSLARRESLTPTVRMMRQLFFGLKGGKEGTLIRGLARFFQPWGDDEIDLQHLYLKLDGTSPSLLVNRAKEKAEVARESAPYYLAQDLVRIYNQNRRSGHRLFPSMIEKRREGRRPDEEEE